MQGEGQPGPYLPAGIAHPGEFSPLEGRQTTGQTAPCLMQFEVFSASASLGLCQDGYQETCSSAPSQAVASTFCKPF